MSVTALFDGTVVTLFDGRGAAPHPAPMGPGGAHPAA
jgi:hypothetical protein